MRTRFVILLAVILCACSAVEAAPEPTADTTEVITLPVSIYILDDDTGALSSGRTLNEIQGIFDNVDWIWRQAHISFDVKTIQRLTLPTVYLRAIALGNFEPLFGATQGDVFIPEPSLLNAFYAQYIGGPNGIALSNANMFFITDNPSVYHERVTSHEIGHLLGLHHTLSDTNRLMYQGTNGMNLNEDEIRIARATARHLLDN